MEPAQTVVGRFGGPTALAELLGIHRTRVSNWQRARASGGTGGTIPQRYHRQLLDYARERNIELKAEDFLPVVEGDTTAPSDSEAERQAS